MDHVRRAFPARAVPGTLAGPAVLCCVLALLMSQDAPAAAQQPASLEQAVKASFLFKFAPFVSWPAAAQPPQGGPFNICLRGEDPFGATLDEVVRGQRISGRSVSVRRLGDGGNLGGCQMLFAGRSAATSYAPFAEIDGQPILTVSDQKSGVDGAMIQFVMQNGRVRFQIDSTAARANGLTISSKLLGMAVSVDRR
jgi:hypothetical protein